MTASTFVVVPRSILRWIIPLSTVTVFLSTTTNSFVSRSYCRLSPRYLLNEDNNRIMMSSIADTSSDANGSTSLSESSFLPDYGTTPIEIDQIKILKKKWRRPELFGQSLIEQTMNEINDSYENVKKEEQVQLTKEERIAQRRSLQQAKSVPNFEQHVHAMAAAAATATAVTSASSSQTTSPISSSLQLLHRKSIPTILQINIGLYCNQACQHCHGTFFWFKFLFFI